MWKPILLDNLYNLILSGVLELNDKQRNFWNLVKIDPEKWEEIEYGNEGGGFWVCAIFGNEVIWYNDIEEGFNISKYDTYGHIGTYECSQAELNWSVIGLMERINAN
jgi:hypothetical protein